MKLKVEVGYFRGESPALLHVEILDFVNTLDFLVVLLAVRVYKFSFGLYLEAA